MSDSKLRGVVHLIEQTKSFGQKGFRKRLVVIEQENGRFPNFIPVEFIQDACDRVDDLNVGNEVEVTYRLSGRKWQKDAASEVKYFLSCEATGFRVVGAGATDEGVVPTDINDSFAQAAYENDDEVPF
jgi:Domain of unknown function (DUF3127)